MMKTTLTVLLLAFMLTACSQRSPELPQTFTNQKGIEFVLVPAGSFMMGSTRSPHEQPVHQVTIAQPFLMGRYEVTQAQWQRVMGTSVAQQRDRGSASLPLVGEGAQYPMYYVSWDEAQEFIQRLNSQDDGYTYRLPTEAEWEYACRAGTTGDYAGSLNAMAWYDDNSDHTTHPVGQKQPNSFGLYDMHGNVEEWCEDWSHENYNGAPTDGSAWINGGTQQHRVLRGASWFLHASDLRSSLRNLNVPRYRSDFAGFRVVAVARSWPLLF
jgi:formylglycine-generating enzyme required for sulfatase activity